MFTPELFASIFDSNILFYTLPFIENNIESVCEIFSYKDFIQGLCIISL